MPCRGIPSTRVIERTTMARPSRPPPGRTPSSYADRSLRRCWHDPGLAVRNDRYSVLRSSGGVRGEGADAHRSRRRSLLPGAARAPPPRRSRLGRCLWTLRARLIESRSEEHTSELQSQSNLVCRLLLEKKKQSTTNKLAGAGAVSHCPIGPRPPHPDRSAKRPPVGPHTVSPRPFCAIVAPTFHVTRQSA